ncbi:hypothetical protein PR202_ga17735 [Eleusine coracana subsp. coracana]|uniref:GRAM domain-containing protein n=1 Tax=Eleusine coracana subsp. coracana TaxID=191504 RepID=A0AAV5CQT2_ELECO|nr:hypothetical protein PR202_ga17488 [Eleusine coracana subsp. coracana]GJN00545.1 hypothetical protein PR202_ga17735 [Eleusine coracana subsp. coracana]
MQQPPAEMHPAVDVSNSAAAPAPAADATQAPAPAVAAAAPDPSSEPAAAPAPAPEGSDPPPAPAQKTVTWSEKLTSDSPTHVQAAAAAESSQYVSRGPASSSSKELSDTRLVTAVRILGSARLMRRGLGEFSSTVKTGPSFTEAAMGRLAQGTKVLAEGGYEKIFKQTFEVLPDEQLKICYACYLSTSAGPVMGVLYISTAKIAFCSDNPLSYKAGNKTEWSYYKVVIPLHQLRTANPSVSKVNPAEKYIQVVSVEGHEFWFMGFLMYDKAVTSLQEALANARELQP